MKQSLRVRTLLSTLIIPCFLFIHTGRVSAADQMNPQTLKTFISSVPKANEVLFMYLGSSGLILKVADQTILIDPAGYLDAKAMESLKAVNLVLFTHGHGDHLNVQSAVQLYERFKTSIVCQQSLVAKFEQKIPEDKLITATPGKPVTAGKINVDSVEGKHPGTITLFRMTVDGITIFHAGDSGYVPLKDYPSQVAFLPVGGASPTASPDDALKMVAELNPQVTAVFHGKDQQYISFKSKMTSTFSKIKIMVCKVGESGKATVIPAAEKK